MTTPVTTTDVVAAILGEDVYGRVRHLLEVDARQITEMQTYYDVLFDPEPASLAALDLRTRALVAMRVAVHTRSHAVADWYREVAVSAGAVDAELTAAAQPGAAPEGPPTLVAALHRADHITAAPATAERSDVDALTTAGLTPAGILSLSQVIAFLAYQVRFLAILRAIGGATA